MSNDQLIPMRGDGSLWGSRSAPILNGDAKSFKIVDVIGNKYRILAYGKCRQDDVRVFSLLIALYRADPKRNG